MTETRPLATMTDDLGPARISQIIRSWAGGRHTAICSIPAVFAALGPGGLTQASGEAATGAQQTTFNAMNQFIGLLTDPVCSI
jgi:hypothetical protein